LSFLPKENEVRFDPNNFTLTLDLTDCTRCHGSGLVSTRIDCRTCKGTGKGARGGVRGCKSCYGSGNGYDHVNRSTCEKCNGSPQRAEMETWCDGVPTEAVAALQLRIARQDRAVSWNESFLGLGCLWSSADYGRAWEREDIEILSDIREKLLADRTQATKLLAAGYDREATTAEIVRGLVIVVTHGGYSVRADTELAESNAEREPDRAVALQIGMAVYRSGGNGTMAAAMPLPETKRPAIAHRCPECEQMWTVDDDPNEWVYGHDCEA
jgi:hypothetical protein